MSILAKVKTWLGNMIGNNNTTPSKTLKTKNAASEERIARYGRMIRAYDGVATRIPNSEGTVTTDQTKLIRYNFGQVICKIKASWLAGKPVSFSVDDNDDLGEDLQKLWARSGDDSAFHQGALAWNIFGDMAIALKGEGDDARIEFIEPSICEPEFNPHDVSQLIGMRIFYELPGEGTKGIPYEEIWGANSMQVYIDGSASGDPIEYEYLPWRWVPRDALRCRPFGISAIDPIYNLQLSYDHFQIKRGQSVDRYAHPTPWFSGVSKTDDNFIKNLDTAYFLPADGKCGFLLPDAMPEDVKEHLSDILFAICDNSETPIIVLGRESSSTANMSGVALDILFGPIKQSTIRDRGAWGPALEYLGWLHLYNSGHEKVERLAVNLNWPDPMPHDEQEAIAVLATKVTELGVSKAQAQRELGYSAKQITEMATEVESETESIGEHLLTQFNRDSKAE